MFFIFLSRLALSKAEVRPYRRKITIVSFIFFVCMLIVFSASVYFGTIHLSSDTSTINNSEGFAAHDQRVIENSFYSEGNQKLHLSWRSHLDEGNLVFTLKSPTQEIVYTASGSTNEMVTIPLTEGEWNYSVTIDDGNGRYSFRGLIK